MDGLTMVDMLNYATALREGDLFSEQELEMRKAHPEEASIFFTLRAIFASRRRIESKMSDDQLKWAADFTAGIEGKRPGIKLLNQSSPQNHRTENPSRTAPPL
jgi:hypothetical protein